VFLSLGSALERWLALPQAQLWAEERVGHEAVLVVGYSLRLAGESVCQTEQSFEQLEFLLGMEMAHLEQRRSNIHFHMSEKNHRQGQRLALVDSWCDKGYKAEKC